MPDDPQLSPTSFAPPQCPMHGQPLVLRRRRGRARSWYCPWPDCWQQVETLDDDVPGPKERAIREAIADAERGSNGIFPDHSTHRQSVDCLLTTLCKSMEPELRGGNSPNAIAAFQKWLQRRS